MSSRLVLHAPTLDATAAAQLLLERWPGAELVEHDGNEPPPESCHGRDCWTIGLDWGEQHDAKNIDPTPDASCVMQVWRRLQTKAAVGADMGRLGSPPWHVRYIDDAACGRWALPCSREVWAYVCSFPTEEALSRLLEIDGSWFTKQKPVEQGRAILRARKRWEKGVHLRLAEAWGQQENEELREEAMRLNGVCERLRTERDAAIAEAEGLRAGLREALDNIGVVTDAYPAPIVHASNVLLAALTGVDHE